MIALTSSRLQLIPLDHSLLKSWRQFGREAVEKELNSGQGNLFASQIVAQAAAIYEKLVTDFKNNLIEIPRMDLVQGEVTASFDDFDLDSSGFNYDQLNEEIVRIGLKDKKMDFIDVKKGVYYGKPEKLLISELINFSEIDYDKNSDLLHKLAKQAIAELQSNLKEGEDMNTLVFQWRQGRSHPRQHCTDE
jgi:type III restriction enzyme